MLRGWLPYLASLTVWLAHWTLCWIVALVWQGERTANILAIFLTVVALIVLAWMFRRFQTVPGGDEGLEGWGRRLALSTTIVAAVATIFNVMPALFLDQ